MSSRRHKWLAAIATVVLTYLMIRATRVNFFVSPAWLRVSLLVALPVAVWVGWWTRRLMRSVTLGDRPKPPPWARILAGWVLIPLATYFACWLVVGRFVPDLITRAAGEPFSETHLLAKRRVHSRRHCDYQVRGNPFAGQLGKDHYCAWTSEYERLPDKGRMAIRGRATWFGRHIESVEPIAEATLQDPK